MHYKADPHVKYFLQGVTFLLCLAVCLLLISLSAGTIAEIFLISVSTMLIWIIVGLFYIPLCIRRIRITVTDTQITLDSGIFLIRSRSLLIRSLQLSSILQTPFSRYTGLNFIPLRSYGGSLILPFLNQKDAQELHAFFTIYLLANSSQNRF